MKWVLIFVFTAAALFISHTEARAAGESCSAPWAIDGKYLVSGTCASTCDLTIEGNGMGGTEACPSGEICCGQKMLAPYVDYGSKEAIPLDTGCFGAAQIRFGAANIERTECDPGGSKGCTSKGGQPILEQLNECSDQGGAWCCAYLVGNTCASVAEKAFGGPGTVEVAQCIGSTATCPEGLKEMSDKGDCGARSEFGNANYKCCAKPKAGGSASSTKGSSTTLTNPLGQGTNFFTIIRRIITTFLGFVGALALLVFVYAGITWMTAGSSDRIQNAKDTMKYAVIGLVLIIFSYAITAFFIKTIGGG